MARPTLHCKNWSNKSQNVSKVSKGAKLCEGVIKKRCQYSCHSNCDMLWLCDTLWHSAVADVTLLECAWVLGCLGWEGTCSPLAELVSCWRNWDFYGDTTEPAADALVMHTYAHASATTTEQVQGLSDSVFWGLLFGETLLLLVSLGISWYLLVSLGISWYLLVSLGISWSSGTSACLLQRLAQPESGLHICAARFARRMICPTNAVFRNRMWHWLRDFTPKQLSAKWNLLKPCLIWLLSCISRAYCPNPAIQVLYHEATEIACEPEWDVSTNYNKLKSPEANPNVQRLRERERASAFSSPRFLDC